MKAFRFAVIVLLVIIAAGVWVVAQRTKPTPTSSDSTHRQTYETVMPDGKTYRIEGPKGQTDIDVQREVAQQHPESTIPINLPREVTVREFMDTVNPRTDKPVAIAPPCKDNQLECAPADRMWGEFPGKLEPGDIMTPNGLIYRLKK
jgi:hypothetical protein